MSEFAELHDELRSVAADVLGRNPDPEDVWRQAVALGWTSLEIPETAGGSGATLAETAVVLEELGRAAASGPFIGSAVLGAAAVMAVEPSPERDELLAGLAGGVTRVAVAAAPNADTATAAPAFALAETGRPDGALIITGRAKMVIDAPDADRLLVLADGVDGRGCIVALAADRARVASHPTLDETRRLGTVSADGVAVDAEDVWAFAGDASIAMQPVVDRAVLAVALDSLGVASAMVDETVRYVTERSQFDRPVGSFQAVKHICADMMVQLRIGRELTDEALAAEPVDFSVAAARAKSFVTAAAVDIVGSALQLHGGIGYTWEHPLHRYLKRAVLNRALFGSPAHHRRRLGDRIAAQAIANLGGSR